MTTSPQKSQWGMTLAELMIASMLLGLVLIGIAAVGYSINSVQEGASREQTMAGKTQGSIFHVARNLLRTSGYSTSPGMSSPDSTAEGLWYASNASGQYICLRRESGIPGNPTDDDRICYSRTLNGTLSSPNKTLMYCLLAVTDPVGFCDNSDSATIALVNLTNDDWYSIVRDSDGNVDYIELKFESIYDANSSSDAMLNPTYQMTTRISPTSLSR